MAKAALENAVWDAEAQAEAGSALETARRHATRDRLRRLASAFRTRIEQLMREDRNRTGRGLSAHQGQG